MVPGPRLEYRQLNCLGRPAVRSDSHELVQREILRNYRGHFGKMPNHVLGIKANQLQLFDDSRCTQRFRRFDTGPAIAALFLRRRAPNSSATASRHQTQFHRPAQRHTDIARRCIQHKPFNNTDYDGHCMAMSSKLFAPVGFLFFTLSTLVSPLTNFQQNGSTP